MGRCNTNAKPTRRAFSGQGSFARVDLDETPLWLGSGGAEPYRSVLRREALSTQQSEWCCVDRLSWHDVTGEWKLILRFGWSSPTKLKKRGGFLASPQFVPS